MKKILLIVGIVCLAACGLSLLFALFNRFGYYNVLDGDSDLYSRLQQRMNIGFAVSVVLAAVGIVCLIIYAKL